jgi:hypothetical protein
MRLILELDYSSKKIHNVGLSLSDHAHYIPFETTSCRRGPSDWSTPSIAGTAGRILPGWRRAATHSSISFVAGSISFLSDRNSTKLTSQNRIKRETF